MAMIMILVLSIGKYGKYRHEWVGFFRTRSFLGDRDVSKTKFQLS